MDEQQLWIVFFDDVAQRSVLPYASSEEKALSLWLEQTGLHWIARARLRAVPKARDRAGTVDPGEETKGYDCWVVTSRTPHRTGAWVATTREDAVAQVKQAVRINQTEGGVESRNPRHPFEATFSLVNEKIVTTKFREW